MDDDVLEKIPPCTFLASVNMFSPNSCCEFSYVYTDRIHAWFGILKLLRADFPILLYLSNAYFIHRLFGSLASTCLSNRRVYTLMHNEINHRLRQHSKCNTVVSYRYKCHAILMLLVFYCMIT